MARLALLRAERRMSLAGVALLALAMSLAPVAREPDREPEVRRTWYANGVLASERTYIDGREAGTHRGWWPAGTPKFVYEYEAGALEGASKEWFSSGALYREQNYGAGHERGLQRMYWEDGRVRASYEVRDGRRFGLMGSKGCVTKADTTMGGVK